jgi:hypothetical protein
MRPLPAAIVVEALSHLRRREHHLAILSVALASSPQLLQPLHFRPRLELSLYAPITRLDPLEPTARALLPPIPDETKTGTAIDPDASHPNLIVA